ncbi:cation diffusion facilitator family transporter [Massilia sp. TWR1-2-2]|uniref:cation diffusion facilitator family transporter n=1 Tax=Massilia sp. TWR1-2-2 TaxID=2804584 RepID=UPI003CFA102F
MNAESPAPSSAHLHAHRAGDAKHAHFIEARSQKALAGALVLTLLFAVIEVVTGFISNSLALISDAGHMVTDAAALGLALLAQLIAKRPPSARHSFGFGRAEALAAFVNCLAMLALVGWIVYEAVRRFADPQPVQGAIVLGVAAVGIVINLLVAWMLSRDHQNMNTRAAMVNVMGDLLGSIAAVVAGAVIHFTGWVRIDPLLSVFVSLLILKSTIGVLRESYHFLMKGVPDQIDYVQVGADLAALDGVKSVHDLHIWEMSPGEPALIGHLEIADLARWPQVLRAVQDMLLAKHGIDHVTLQPETPDARAHAM